MDRRGIEPRANGCEDLRVNHHHGPFLTSHLAACRIGDQTKSRQTTKD